MNDKDWNKPQKIENQPKSRENPKIGILSFIWASVRPHLSVPLFLGKTEPIGLDIAHKAFF